MSRNTAVLAVVIALVVGAAIGYALGQRAPPSGTSAPPSLQNLADVFRAAAQQGGTDTARQNCALEKLGPERYAALVLNPNAVTTEDQFKILPCYQ